MAQLAVPISDTSIVASGSLSVEIEPAAGMSSYAEALASLPGSASDYATRHAKITQSGVLGPQDSVDIKCRATPLSTPAAGNCTLRVWHNCFTNGDVFVLNGDDNSSVATIGLTPDPGNYGTTWQFEDLVFDPTGLVHDWSDLVFHLIQNDDVGEAGTGGFTYIALETPNAAPLTTGALLFTNAETINESPWLDEPWVNPTNALTDSGTYAQVTATTFDNTDQTAVLKLYGPVGISIPTGATIVGVIVRIEARADGVLVKLDLVQLLDTARAKVGTNLAATPVALSTTDTVYTFGDSANTWGNALTEAWVEDADFGVAIGALASTNNSEVYIDFADIEVFYTAAPAVTTSLLYQPYNVRYRR